MPFVLDAAIKSPEVCASVYVAVAASNAFTLFDKVPINCTFANGIEPLRRKAVYRGTMMFHKAIPRVSMNVAARMDRIWVAP